MQRNKLLVNHELILCFTVYSLVLNKSVDYMVCNTLHI